MLREEMSGKRGGLADPMSILHEEATRDAVGLETYVFVEEIARHLAGRVRDIVVSQPFGNTGEIGRVTAEASRDEIGKSGRSP